MGREQLFTVAVDAMGSDSHPAPEVEGAVRFLREHPNARVILVGHEERIRPELSTYKADGLPLDVIHTDECIGMMEHPVHAIRKKRKASMRVAMDLVKDGRAQGFITAGNTGACMALSKLLYGTCKGVDRPALATAFPTIKAPTIVIDVGANVDCKPLHLEQFAIMGHIYSKLIFGMERPRVALLSIGEEEIKGNELTREVHQALKASTLNFCGNVEGKDVFGGDVDVVVCDGFTGNVALKITEGVIGALLHLIRTELKRNVVTQVGALLSRSAYQRLKTKIDYSEYGGAPLLGVPHPVIIGHGRSNAHAIKNAILFVRELHINQVPRRIEEEIGKFMREHQEHEV